MCRSALVREIVSVSKNTQIELSITEIFIKGQKFALLEMKCTIVKILRSFEISLEPGFVLKLNPEIVLKPLNGVKLKLKVRNICS